MEVDVNKIKEDFSKLNVHRKYILVIISIVIIFICLMLFQDCKHNTSENKIVTELTQYKTKANHYEDNFGNIIATNNAINLHSQKQINSILSQNDTLKKWLNKFKNIKFGGVIKETIQIKEVLVPFETKIPCNFNPFPAIKLDKNYRFYSTIANTGLTIDSLFIPNTANIIVGEKKSGFLGLNKKLTVEVKNSNSLISVSDISGFTYTPKKKHFGIGLSTGYGINFNNKSVSTSPFIGVSVNYNLITF